jgi:hypothetical protein
MYVETEGQLEKWLEGGQNRGLFTSSGPSLTFLTFRKLHTGGYIYRPGALKHKISFPIFCIRKTYQ